MPRGTRLDGTFIYTPKEKQDYHYKQCKKGAKKMIKDENGNPKEVQVSDFERGAHKAQGDMIFKKRKAKAMSDTPQYAYNRANYQYKK